MNDLTPTLPAIGEYVKVRTKLGDEFAGRVVRSGQTKLGLEASRLDCDRYYIPADGDVLLYRGTREPSPYAPAPVARVTSARLLNPGRAPSAPVIKRGGRYVEREVRKAWVAVGIAILFVLYVLGATWPV